MYTENLRHARVYLRQGNTCRTGCAATKVWLPNAGSHAPDRHHPCAHAQPPVLGRGIGPALGHRRLIAACRGLWIAYHRTGAPSWGICRPDQRAALRPFRAAKGTTPPSLSPPASGHSSGCRDPAAAAHQAGFRRSGADPGQSASADRPIRRAPG